MTEEEHDPSLAPGDPRLCSWCVGEPFLREQIETEGSIDICHYCGVADRTFSVDQVADRIAAALQTFYWDWGQDSSSDSPVAQVIAREAGIGPEIAEDIRQFLDARYSSAEKANPDWVPYAKDSYYSPRESVDTRDLNAGWHRFETSLKHENRFFNRHGEDFLALIFTGLDDHITARGNSVIVEVGPGTSYERLYRARVFEDSDELTRAVLQPDREIGPPPPQRARAGRMNPAGVSVFYGATSSRVALAEVRPPSGSKVVVGAFEVRIRLRLLDLSALEHLRPAVGSRLDPEYVECLKRAEFLRKLGLQLSKPVMPSDEVLSYLPTQAVANYLATAAGLHGIIYPSVQAGLSGRFAAARTGIHETNVVLFPSVTRVQAMKKGLSVSNLGAPGEPIWQSVSRNFFLGEEPEVKIEDEAGVQYVVLECHKEPEDAPVAPLFLSEISVLSVKAVRVDAESSTVSRYPKTEGDNAPGLEDNRQ